MRRCIELLPCWKYCSAPGATHDSTARGDYTAVTNARPVFAGMLGSIALEIAVEPHRGWDSVSILGGHAQIS